ncbi:hypothetical protein [Methylophaga pinxianii]|uniref:hypothetical protein n=1 Tax=Methylophaga pinxianii TaxID=2881052 RepID=UPI001CF110AF|nr:hypothetical protein [Methylophaga pinxianii]MCB2425446.1 hypothetical protein [Methylophaga pinxianii]UPH44718.1 hypothetical protein LGT42_009350 [Methylophaga pinxianii]
MTQHRNASITLYHWNILILLDEREIFVGLRQRPETVPPFSPPKNQDELLPFQLQNSSAISKFDEYSRVGFDVDGTRYVVIGNPGDPTGLIRMSVSQMMKAEEIRWKYDFID